MNVFSVLMNTSVSVFPPSKRMQFNHIMRNMEIHVQNGCKVFNHLHEMIVLSTCALLNKNSDSPATAKIELLSISILLVGLKLVILNLYQE